MSQTADAFDYSAATVPQGALFVAADEPLLVFPSIKAAENWVEAIDVENGVYGAAYGSEGEPHHIGTVGNRVVIEPTGEPNRPEDLRALLVKYLQTTGQTFDDRISTAELVQQVWRVESDFWRENDPYGDRFSKPLPRSCCVALVLIPLILICVFITRDWTTAPAIILVTLLIGGIAELARRKADRMDFRGG